MRGSSEMKNFFTAILLSASIILSGSVLHAKENPGADEIYKKMADTLSRVDKKLPNKTIAIYGFEVIGRSGDSYAKFATEKLTHQLVSNGSLMVIERSRIDQILKEQSLSMTGAVDSGTAAKIGKILAVDAVVIGTIRVTESEVEFIARVIQSEKGIILASANEKLITASTQGDTSTGDKNFSDAVDDSKNTYNNAVTILKPGKTHYTRFEQVIVNYSGLPGNQNDWITLVVESAPDSTYGEWFYTQGQKSGTYIFKGVEPGNYEVRVYFDWPNGGYLVRQRLKIKVK